MKALQLNEAVSDHSIGRTNLRSKQVTLIVLPAIVFSDLYIHQTLSFLSLTDLKGKRTEVVVLDTPKGTIGNSSVKVTTSEEAASFTIYRCVKDKTGSEVKTGILLHEFSGDLFLVALRFTPFLRVCLVVILLQS